MTDIQIKEAMASDDLEIEHIDEGGLQGAGYDARVGGRALLSGEDDEINVAQRGSVTIRPGDFVLIITREKFKLSPDIAGHLGIRSYYSRKGFVVLAGLQIDPGFEGHLVIGGFNAAPRRLTLDYESPFLTVEFHRLAHAVGKQKIISGDELIKGQIPRIDKDYLRTLETQSLSDVAEELRNLASNVGAMQSQLKIFYAPVMFLILAAVIGFGISGN